MSESYDEMINRERWKKIIQITYPERGSGNSLFTNPKEPRPVNNAHIEFYRFADGRRVDPLYNSLTSEQQAVYDSDIEVMMSVNQSEPASAGKSASFISVLDSRGQDRRLKVTRINEWLGDSNGWTRVYYGRELLHVPIPLEEFDKLIESAGGQIAESAYLNDLIERRDAERAARQSREKA